MKKHWPLFPKDFPKCGVLFWMGVLAYSLVVTIFADCSSL